jgi:beta-lactamase class A
MLDKREVAWNEELILTEDTIGGGSGWMAYQKIGQKFPVFEVASEMIRVSDNTATNLLIKRIGGINIVNEKFKEIGLKNTQINNFLPDLDGTNLTSTKDLSLAMALVDNGYLLKVSSRDIFREIMRKSKTNTLIPYGILRGLGKENKETDYHLSLKGYLVHNKTGDIGISYSDTALIQTPLNSRAFASFIVKGPFNDPRSPELIRNLSAELVPFLVQDQK